MYFLFWAILLHLSVLVIFTAMVIHDKKPGIKNYRKYHCYFVIKHEIEKDEFISISGRPLIIKNKIDKLFQTYPHPFAFWGRLMTMKDFENDKTNNKKILCNIQFNTKILEV